MDPGWCASKCHISAWSNDPGCQQHNIGINGAILIQCRFVKEERNYVKRSSDMGVTGRWNIGMDGPSAYSHYTRNDTHVGALRAAKVLVNNFMGICELNSFLDFKCLCVLCLSPLQCVCMYANTSTNA